MSTSDPIKALEEINSEYIRLNEYESKEARLGRHLTQFCKSFPFHLLRWAKTILANRSLRKKNDSISSYVSPEDFFYASPDPVTDKKGVVYTCITGGYDTPFEPVYKSDALDYVLFTDKTDEPAADSVWQRRSIDGLEIKAGSNLANRYYKFHPHEFFSDYDYSIYIDGNVQVISDLTGLYRVAGQSPAGIAMHRHFARKCIYQEAKWCEYNKRGNQENIQRQMSLYRQEGFPENFGLCEATVIVADLKNQTSEKLMNAWWDEFCRAQAGRDQLAFPYILWKNGYSTDDIGSLGNDEYHNPKFRINAHKGKLF